MNEGPLLVIDVGSIPEPPLMKRAEEVAAALKLDVFIACCRDESDLPPPLPAKRQRVQDVRAKLLSRCRRALERRLDAFRAGGIEAGGCVQRAGAVKTAVLQLVQERSPALVMMLRKPHTRFEQATLGGDEFAIIRSSPAPVWLVHPSHQDGDKIVGAIGTPRSEDDGGTLNDRILDEVSLLAKKLGKESHALHAFGEAGVVYPVEPAAEDPSDDMGTSRTDERIQRILDFATAHGLAPEHAHIYEGRLERVLEEEVEPMNADLIVVGARSDGRLKRMMSGGTAERIIEHVDTDVLVLKSSERQASPP